jgi:hypothetical protein
MQIPKAEIKRELLSFMNKRKLLAVLAAAIVTGMVVVSCVKDKGEIPKPTVNACDTITYTKHIKPLIDQYCASCHGPQPSAGAPLLTTYDETKNNGTKIKNTILLTPPVPELMPQGGPALPEAQKALISCWLNNGMKQ